MATHHAVSNEIVDLKTWAQDMPHEKTRVIFKTSEMEVARLVLPAGKTFREHQVTGPITVHCIEGSFTFSAQGISQQLSAGQLLYLQPGEPHSLTGLTDAVILLTIVFKS